MSRFKIDPNKTAMQNLWAAAFQASVHILRTHRFYGFYGQDRQDLITDVERFAEHNAKKKQVRDVPEEVRKRRSERMKEMRARGIGGWPKKGSSAPENANDGVSHAEG